MGHMISLNSRANMTPQGGLEQIFFSHDITHKQASPDAETMKNEFSTPKNIHVHITTMLRL